jgi:hypothetical protein
VSPGANDAPQETCHAPSVPSQRCAISASVDFVAVGWITGNGGPRDSAFDAGAARCVGSKGVVLQQAEFENRNGVSHSGSQARSFSKQTGSTRGYGFPAEEGTPAQQSQSVVKG